MDTGLGAKAYAIIEQGKIGLILSSRPTDRRQLIEEAAGVTKYKARRRAAELKLEAAQQNLTRIDDIVFEVEKQRGTLKRQAGQGAALPEAARRAAALGEGAVRPQVPAAGRDDRVGARAAADARERESVAAARVAEVESDLGARAHRAGRGRIARHRVARERRTRASWRSTASSSRSRSTASRSQALEARTATVAAELDVLDARREPARAAARRRGATAAADANAERDRAAAALAAESGAYDTAHREIEGLEADVEAARSEVFSAINSATALRHALEHAAAARDRVAETLSKLDVEADDVRIESERAARGPRRGRRRRCAARTRRSRRRASRGPRANRSWPARASSTSGAPASVRSREHELAGLEARLKSLEELDAARAGYGDAARTVLVQANGKVSQQGAIADYLEVEAGYERAVEACLGDLLQHVVVERPEHAAAGFQLVREAGAGRCGFLVTSAVDRAGRSVVHRPAERHRRRPDSIGADARPGRRDARRHRRAVVGRPRQRPVRRRHSRRRSATRGSRRRTTRAAEASRADAAAGRDAGRRRVPRSASRVAAATAPRRAAFSRPSARSRSCAIASRRARRAGPARRRRPRSSKPTIAHASNAIAALNAEHHRQEKAVVGHDAQLQHATDEADAARAESASSSRARRCQAEEERDTLDRRQEEARASIARLDDEQRAGRRAADRGAAPPVRGARGRRGPEPPRRRRRRRARRARRARRRAWRSKCSASRKRPPSSKQRAAALAAELDDTARPRRRAAGGDRRRRSAARRRRPRARRAARDGDDGRRGGRGAARQDRRARSGDQGRARRARQRSRRRLGARRRARDRGSDLSHLAHTCEDAVNATLDEVVVEVEQLERDGHAIPDAASSAADEPDEDERSSPLEPAAVTGPDRPTRGRGRGAAHAQRRGSDRRAARARSSGSGRST